MNFFDFTELVFAAVAAWIGGGLVGGGLMFASMQKKYPAKAAENYSSDLFLFWMCVLFGLASPVAWAFCLLIGLRAHGILFPGSSGWSRSDAEALQRRTIQGGDTTVD